MHAPRQPDAVTTACVLFRFCFFLSLEMSLFPSIFCTINVFSLYEEYVLRFFLPDGVFLPCDHGLDSLHQLILCDNLINQSNVVLSTMQRRFNKYSYYSSDVEPNPGINTLPLIPQYIFV